MSALDKINPIELGQRLQVARNTAGMMPATVTQTMGLSRSTLVAIESGKRQLKSHELVQLAELYDVSCNSLLRPNAVHVDIALQFRQNVLGYENNSDVLETERVLQKLASSYVELERILGKELRTFYPPEYPIIKGNVYEQAEDLALEVRHHLGLGLAPISNIMTLLESELKILCIVGWWASGCVDRCLNQRLRCLAIPPDEELLKIFDWCLTMIAKKIGATPKGLPLL